MLPYGDITGVHFLLFLQGFPGDIGPPGQNGPEGPKVSRTTSAQLEPQKLSEP